MKNFRIPEAVLIIICVVVSPVLPVEISKDTVYVNDFDFNSRCYILNVRIDTLKLWNAVNSQVTLDSFEIIFNPSSDGLFRGTDCEVTKSGSEINALDIAILIRKDSLVLSGQTYEDTLVWIKNGRIECLIQNNPPYNKITIPEALISPDFNSYLNFTGADTCVIYAICFTPCFQCHNGTSGYFIDFSAQITLYYSDGSKVSFHGINEYSAEVNTRPDYHIPGKKDMPDNGMFNIKGQKMFHRSFGRYSPGIYLRTIENAHRESRLLLYSNRAFDGESDAAP